MDDYKPIPYKFTGFNQKGEPEFINQANFEPQKVQDRKDYGYRAEYTNKYPNTLFVDCPTCNEPLSRNYRRQNKYCIVCNSDIISIRDPRDK